MADVEQKEDGTLLMPTLDLGATRGIGSAWSEYDITCQALGLEANTEYRAEMTKIERVNADGSLELFNLDSAAGKSSQSLTNAQGDFSTLISMRYSGLGLFSKTQKIQATVTDAFPYEYLYPTSDEAKYFKAQGALFVDEDVNEPAYKSNFISTLIIQLRKQAGNILIKEVRVPIAYKVHYMVERNYAYQTTNYVVDAINCDFDTPINELQSATLLTIETQRAIVPYNKTTDREVIHLDYRVKSDSVDQDGIRTITVPFSVSDNDLFKVSTAGGKLFSIDSITDNGDGTTTLSLGEDATGTYYVGIEYGLRYELGNLEYKVTNQDGRTKSTNRSIKDKLATMTFAYSDSVTFDVEVQRPKRDDRVVSFISTQLGYSNIAEADLRTGEFRFHVKGNTSDTVVSVVDSSVFPLQLQHVEIERSVTSRSKR